MADRIFMPTNKTKTKMKTNSILKNAALGLVFLLILSISAAARQTYKGPVDSGFRIDAVGNNEFVIHPNVHNGHFILELPAEARVQVSDANGMEVANKETESGQTVSFRINSDARVLLSSEEGIQRSTITLQ